MLQLTLLALLSSAPLALTAPGVPTPSGGARADAFGDQWHDGKAELCGYVWTGSRYGQERQGEAIAITVTEPFSKSRHVKLDSTADAADVLPVLKLNLVRDFQTGVYDYNTMTSCFMDERSLALVKSTFSSAEWCGHVFEAIDVRAEATRVTVDSYFDGESEDEALATEPGGLIGDQLLVWLRGLRSAPMAPGETIRRPFLSGSFERRLRHTPAAWGAIRITRELQLAPCTVPAGTFEAVTYRLQASDGREGVVKIENAPPKRLLSWSWTRGGNVLDSGQLTGSQRLPYWSRHGNGDERIRSELGLGSNRAR